MPFALLHVVAERAVELLERLEAGDCVMLWFHAAIVVHIVQSRAEEKDPGDGDHGVPESVVAPHAGGRAEERSSKRCGSTMWVPMV